MSKFDKASCVIVILQFFVQWPLSIFLGYLLYRHVGATDLMWFVWIINLILGISLTTSLQIIREVFKK